jgi:hypothetical protein
LIGWLNCAKNYFDLRLRVGTASGGERGSINKSFSKDSLATARGTDPEAQVELFWKLFGSLG